MDKKYVKGIEENDDKDLARKRICQQVIDFCHQTNKPIRMLSLPAKTALFEKMLIARCKKDGIKIQQITGVEQNLAIRKVAMKGIDTWGLNPNRIEIAKGNIDRYVNNIAASFNVVWVDYCGNPATFNAKFDRYYYPHLNAFIQAVKTNPEPFVYFATFCCNGRIKNGYQSMLNRLHGTSKNLESAIKSKILAMLVQCGLRDRVTPIMKFSYRGGKRSFMVTIGFAVNFKPSFPIIIENLNKAQKVVKAGKVKVIKQEEKIDIVEVRKQVIRMMDDKGFKSNVIAQTLGIALTKIGPVLAHHRHKDSFIGKAGRKSKKVLAS